MKIFAKVMMIFTFIFVIFGLVRVAMFRIIGYSDYSRFNFLPSYQAFNSWVNEIDLGSSFVMSLAKFKDIVNSFVLPSDSGFWDYVGAFFTAIWKFLTCMWDLFICVVGTPIRFISWLFEFFNLDLVKEEATSQVIKNIELFAKFC